MNKSYGKLAAIALLALMALAPLVASTSFTIAPEYPAGKWRVAFLTLGNKLVPTGIARVFLYNITKATLAPPNYEPKILISWANIVDGIATFIDLPGDVWDAGFGGVTLKYGIEVNYTVGGTVTKILLANYTICQLAPDPAPEMYVDAGGSGLGAMLNNTAVVWEQFTWTDDLSVGDPTRPGYYLDLVPLAFRIADEANYSVVGAGVEMFAKVWQEVAHTTWKQYSLAVATSNGTWGSEFIGNLPCAARNERVGWVEFLAPANFSNIDWDAINAPFTGLANLTFLVRWKHSSPTNGPIVGRLNVSSIVKPNLPPTLPAQPFKIPPGPSSSYTIPPLWLGFEGTTIKAYIGDVDVPLEGGWAYKNFQVNVRWMYWNLTDIMGAPWWTLYAEKFLKWAEGPIGAYEYVGDTVAPGRVLQRYPARLEHWATIPLTTAAYFPALKFNLSAGVEWMFSIVGEGLYDPNTDLPRSLSAAAWYDPDYDYGLDHDAGDFVHFLWDEVYGIGSMEEKTLMVYIEGIKLISSSEVPQRLRDDIALTIILPAGIATKQNVTIAWATNTTGFVTLPDTEALRVDADLIAILNPWDGYSPNPLNYSGWLPSVRRGHTNFIAWYQGIKVLDTTVPGGYLPGNLPPVLDEQHYGLLIDYPLAIYELGFVLEFTPGPLGETRPVPWFTPFFFRHPSGRLIGPTTSAYALDPEMEEQGYGIYDLVKAAPGGSYSDFFIIWKASLIPGLNATTLEPQGPITLNKNLPNIKIVFPVFDLNVTVWTQDPDRIINVDVRLRAETDFSEFGLPYYIIRMITDPATDFFDAVLPWGAIYFIDSVGDLDPTDNTGFEITSSTLTDTSLKWVYWTEFETTGENVLVETGLRSPAPARFIKLPQKTYDIWVRVPGGKWKAAGSVGAALAENAGFRSVDQNKTLYWSQDPYTGVGPVELTEHTWLDLDSYIYDPNVSIKDAGGAALELPIDSHSAIFLVEPWYNATYEDFWDDYVTGTWNPYFIRVNSTDAAGKYKFHSVNATKVNPPVDPELYMLGTDPATVGVADNYEIESRYLIGKSTFQSAYGYRFMVYYKGILVFNASIPLQNPYVSKDHDIITSVYPYVFKITNWPMEDCYWVDPEEWRFGIPNLDVDVYWAGLNLTWWPSFSLTIETAAKEFSLLNASKLLKGFNMTVVKRLWHWVPAGPIVLVEIPYTPVPPYFSAALFVESGVSDANGEFKVLVPVWNYSYSKNIYTYMETDDVNFGVNFDSAYMFEQDPWGGHWDWLGGPRHPWEWALGPLGIHLKTPADREWYEMCLFGTPVYANWTTKPGVTASIPADDVPRLAATLELAYFALDQDEMWTGDDWDWLYSINATGLVNTKTYPTIFKSLSTNGKFGLAGIGILSGGAFQGRQAAGLFEDEAVGPPQPYANFYAKLQVMAPVNDLAVVVLDAGTGEPEEGLDLPNQYVEVIRSSVWYYDWDAGVTVPVEEDVGQAWGYTPIDANPSVLYIRSSPTFMLWGFYCHDIYTTNLTQRTATNFDAWEYWFNDKWQLRPQWLSEHKHGGRVDGGIDAWTSQCECMQWPAKLQLTIYAGDGVRYLEDAWVFIVDAESNENITAALTDYSGYPGSVELPTALQTIWATDPLATGEPRGKFLNLGFNLLKGKYIVKVFFKAPAAPGGVDPFGRVDGVSVWDTFRDQPQHRYIYLGVAPPDTATGEDDAPCQVRTFNTKVYDLKLIVVDQSPSARRIKQAPMRITATDPHPDWVISGTTAMDDPSPDEDTGEYTLTLAPAGKYTITASYPGTLFGKLGTTIVATVEARVIDAPVTVLVPLPIFDATVKLVTPSGRPIVGALVKVAGFPTEGITTDAEGNVLLTQIPAGSFPVTATWFGQPINPTLPLVVTISRTYLLTASNIAVVQVQVVGAQSQGLPGAHVTIKVGATTVFSGMANEDGVVVMELPFGTYTVAASYKGVEVKPPDPGTTMNVTGDMVHKIATGVFMELFGQGLTFAGFALWVVAIIIVVLILVIAAQEYNIYRRKRLPQLFGAGPAR